MSNRRFSPVEHTSLDQIYGQTYGPYKTYGPYVGPYKTYGPYVGPYKLVGTEFILYKGPFLIFISFPTSPPHFKKALEHSKHFIHEKSIEIKDQQQEIKRIK